MEHEWSLTTLSTLKFFYNEKHLSNIDAIDVFMAINGTKRCIERSGQN